MISLHREPTYVLPQNFVIIIVMLDMDMRYILRISVAVIKIMLGMFVLLITHCFVSLCQKLKHNVKKYFHDSSAWSLILLLSICYKTEPQAAVQYVIEWQFQRLSRPSANIPCCRTDRKKHFRFP